MTSHNDDRDHDDDDERTNGRGSYGHSLNIQSEEGEMRNHTTWRALQGPYVLQDSGNAEVNQFVQLAKPAEPMQGFHLGRG